MKTPAQPRLLRGGFTLIELLAVIVIIAILAGISVSGMSYFSRKSAEEKTRAQIQLFAQGLEAFNADVGFYPPLRWNPSIHGATNENPLYTSFDKLGIKRAKTYAYGAGNANTRLTGDPSSSVLIWALGGQGDSKGTIYVPDLADSESDKQNMIVGEKIVDPFGSPFAYRPALPDWNDGNRNKTINPDFDLWSASVDGRIGTSDNANDDITNW